MSLTAREHRLLEQIAVALTVTDPALAAQRATLAGPATVRRSGDSGRRHCLGRADRWSPADVGPAAVGLLPERFIALSAAAFILTRRWPPLPRLRILLHHLTYMPGQHPEGGSNI